VKELCRLQGLQEDTFDGIDGLTDRQVRMMIGNSFSPTVVAAIAARALFAVGLTDVPVGFAFGTGVDGDDEKR
jgi:hypothetical protein